MLNFHKDDVLKFIKAILPKSDYASVRISRSGTS
jgi:hypothetical protein